MNDSRNVIDRYKGWMEDLIRDDVQAKSFDYAVMMENWQGDFNIGTMIRNANGFGAKEVFYIGKRHWDRRGAVGTYKYTQLMHLSTTEELQEKTKDYVLIGIDNVPGAVSISDFEWPRNSLMIFGEEATGLTPEVQKLCTAIVQIPMYGSVRSFNAGSSSAIIMFDYVTKLQRNCGHSQLNDDKQCINCKMQF